MDLAWGDPRTGKFVTNIGLITSSGPHGDNIMAAEWTHYVSYAPGLIMVNIGPRKATLENILKSKEFGVSIAADDQNVVASVAGGSSGRDTNKISALKRLGTKFYKAKKIDVLMVEGAAMNAECRLVESRPLGDHVMIVGEVVEISAGKKEPLVYSDGIYLHKGKPVAKPTQVEREKINEVVQASSKAR